MFKEPQFPPLGGADAFNQPQNFHHPQPSNPKVSTSPAAPRPWAEIVFNKPKEAAGSYQTVLNTGIRVHSKTICFLSADQLQSVVHAQIITLLKDVIICAWGAEIQLLWRWRVKTKWTSQWAHASGSYPQEQNDCFSFVWFPAALCRFDKLFFYFELLLLLWLTLCRSQQ